MHAEPNETWPVAEQAIIGRDRALIDRLTKVLHDEVRRHHDYGQIQERKRGASFEVSLLADGGPTGRIARVTVELDRVVDA